MASIWVIEQGEYSDYSVVGVFTSKENADLMCEALKTSEDAWQTPTVAEWPLDPGVDGLRQGQQRYSVLMRRDGSVERLRQEKLSTYPSLSDHFDEWKREEANVLMCTVWANDDKHAVKIVNERRMQMLATEQWEGKL